MTQFTFSIKTMGCKANIYDSLVLERELCELGGSRLVGDAAPDVFILNSCTVTAEADRQSHREINAMKKKSPGTWTLVTGCYAQVNPKALEANTNIGLVVEGAKKSTVTRAVAEHFGVEPARPAPDPEIFWGQLPTHAGKTRAFVKIQEGCNDYCTYCIIPYARGKSRSMRVGDVLGEIQRLTDGGIREVILTGTNIGDYGKEFGIALEDLVEAILTHTRLPRLRLTSLDPTEISERLLTLMLPEAGAPSRLMPHFHVSLQSPVSRVLRAMKRDYRSEDVVSALRRIHEVDPDIFVGMDVIAGFPGETLEEHDEAVRLLGELPWTRLHVFPYSEREGTPATRIPGSVPIAERRRRAHELIALSNKRHEEMSARFVSRTVDGVLFEGWHEAGGDYYAVGHAPNYMRVLARVPSRRQEDAEALWNTLGSARIVGQSPKPAQEWTLEGVLSSTVPQPADCRQLRC